MKLSDIDRQKLEEMCGDGGIPKWIISDDGDVDISKLQRWISSSIDETAASVSVEDIRRWEMERISRIVKLEEFLNEPKDDGLDYHILTDEEMAVERSEDEEAYKEMLADGIDLFSWVENRMPRDIADMIAGTLIPNTLLKEEVALLKTEEGQNYMLSRMYKVSRTRQSLIDQNCSVKRCTPKWSKCECY